MTIPEDVTINYISPAGVTTDITRSVLYEDAYFEGQAAAVPGSFHLTVKDPTRTLSFVSGGRIEMSLASQPIFGGILSVPTMDFFFSALDTSEPVTGRRWSLDGVDYNMILDKRRLRNLVDLTHFIPAVTSASGNNNDKDIIGLFSTYFDLDFSGGGTIGVTVDQVNDFTSQPLTGTATKTSGSKNVTGSGTKYLDELGKGDTVSIPGGGGTDTLVVTSVSHDALFVVKTAPTHSASSSNARRTNTQFVWPAQGSTMREVLDSIVIETTIHGKLACIYWLNAQAQLRWLAIPSVADESPWGFSDVPTGPAYDTDGNQIYIPFIGWRDGSASEDGSAIINEVFVWGGNPLGSAGQAVLAHKSNQASIDAHGRWQMAEVHPGEDLYKSQAQVNARANALISGDTSGTSPVTGAQGLINLDRQYVLTWYAHDVPIISSVRTHLVPGKTATLNLWSFSPDGGAHPFTLVLPLRQVRVTFPTLPSDTGGATKTFVKFEGTFSLSMSDPVWWWQYLRARRPAPQAAPITTTDNASTYYPYASYFTGTPQESPDGSRTLFSIIPTYMPGTLDVYLGENMLVKGTSYVETDPSAPGGGTFTFTTPPAGGSVINCKCRTG